jgi:predicted TIM-barrel enzyme
MGPKIYPVVHYLDRATAFSEADKAAQGGADGIFLISHHGDDYELLDVGVEIKSKFEGFPVGINLLNTSPIDATENAIQRGYPMLWGDDMGVDSTGVNETGQAIKTTKAAKDSTIEIFASVAFKYRRTEPDPAMAATMALSAGFIPTTSGSATGSAPDVAKIASMSAATKGVLAIASGMTPENVVLFAPHLSHILVATGISIDEHKLDASRLRQLISNSRLR